MLVLTVGLPGSGKSTWARAAQEATWNTVVLSSDDVRRNVFGVEYHRDHPQLNGVVHDLVEAQLKVLLQDPDRTVILDAMNLRKEFRDRWAVIARAAGHEVHVAEMDTPADVCWERKRKLGTGMSRETFLQLCERRQVDQEQNRRNGVDHWRRVRSVL